MNRFFSKLDLRDIKIDPRKTSFAPEDDLQGSAMPAGHHEGDGEPVAYHDAGYAPAGDSPSDGDAAYHAADEHPRADEPPATPESPYRNGGAPRQTYVPSWAASPEAAAEPLDYAPASSAEPLDVAPAPAEPVAEGAVVASDVPVSDDVLKVSARSRPSAVAGAIAGVVREAGRAEVQAIGAGATNQAVKAVAIARDYLRETGIEAVCLPAFIDVTIENEDRTAIRLVIEPR